MFWLAMSDWCWQAFIEGWGADTRADKNKQLAPKMGASTCRAKEKRKKNNPQMGAVLVEQKKGEKKKKRKEEADLADPPNRQEQGGRATPTPLFSSKSSTL